MATNTLQAPADASIWQRVIRFKKGPSPAAARALLELEFSESDRRRMRELAAKARAGTLSTSEEQEAETYERLGCLLDVLHSKARRVLKRRRKAS
ncbi:MAG: hypothetical protein HYS13_04085 [Planctomycetia bacterium]|nr:hypothetical protein [Planctomycetia bacterium]